MVRQLCTTVTNTSAASGQAALFQPTGTKHDGGFILGSNRTNNTLHLGVQGSFVGFRVGGLGSTLEFVAIYRYYSL